MIDKEQLETYRALAAKSTSTLGDVSSALDALPVLLAEVDELRTMIAKLADFSSDAASGISSTTRRLATWKFINEMRARAGL